MDLYGGKGDDKASYTGGEGGYSRIRFTMKKNEEYVIVVNNILNDIENSLGDLNADSIVDVLDIVILINIILS